VNTTRASEMVDLLLTVGYIDGLFHEREQAFVHQYLDSLIQRAAPAGIGMGVGLARIGGDDRAEFDALYAQLNTEIAGLAAEVMATTGASYVPTRLKVRALQIFATLTKPQQATALELVRSLMLADGTIAPQEQSLYDELAGYFASAAESHAAVTAVPPPPTPKVAARPLVVSPPQWLELKSTSHSLLDPLEHTYSPHPQELQSQVAHDYQLVTRAIETWEQMRAAGAGRLAGVTDLAQLPAGSRFLDGHVHVLRADRPVELIVLGDLHGCYGCLKAALLQSSFVERVWAHQWDPARHPDVKLVLLGDYIDRGRFSFDGVLRAVLQLFVAMPEHVVVLRGNHEYFVSAQDGVHSAVHPAEALASITPHVPRGMLEAYLVLFEHMPSSFLFDRTLFVHGGIPRGDTFAAKYRDLSSLNDPELRFQMMWSDPTQTDQVPVALQRQNPRFNFGRDQFRAFMERIGCHTLVRGHEKIDAGFEVVYDLGDRLLLNLFSAGGHDNVDLPPDASYRTVTPMALTIQHGGEAQPTVAIPWPIQYQPFNYATHNAFHRAQPTLAFREV
jgi:hypothetical protein